MRLHDKDADTSSEQSWCFALPPDALDRESAFNLLLGAGDGHVALCTNGTPTLYPIDYRVSDTRIVFRLSPGSLLDELRQGTPIALEVDRRTDLEAWSVIAWGVPRVVTDEREIERFGALSWPWWIASTAYTYVVLAIEVVSGRRIGRGHTSGHAFLGVV
jgi:nitroimidazol reductase NimA-like FMN-containing flavoprotein (pyridoxamine 5'-phosphate oxidase superfamily)